jgi:hypothetical protein
MRRWCYSALGACLLVAGTLAGSCADGDEPLGPATGGGGGASSATGGGSPGTGGGGASGGSSGAQGDGGLTACLDRPDELPRPPMNELPCELLPPGFTR